MAERLEAAGGVVDTTLWIDLPKRLWWTTNDGRRMHWGAISSRTKEIREYVATLSERIPRMEQARIVVTAAYPTAGRQDPANLSGTVSKAAIDGLVDAGVLPDDDSKHLVEVAFRRDPEKTRRGWYQLKIEVIEVSE